MCRANSRAWRNWSSSTPMKVRLVLLRARWKRSAALRPALATYHQVRPEHVFVGNGSDEVLAHAFCALLKHDAPLLFPDITYSFYPVYCRLFGIAYEAVPLDQAMQIRVAAYRRPAGALIVPHPNAGTGVALSRADIVSLLEE